MTQSHEYKLILWGTALVSIAAGAALHPVSVQAVSIEIVAVSPRIVAQNGLGIFDQVSSGLHVVGVGEKVYLRVVPDLGEESLRMIGWNLGERPDGSTADFVFSDSTTATFFPDKEGWFEARVSALNLQTGAMVETKKRILASKYAGAGGLGGWDPVFPECASCHQHQDVWAQWKKTRLANVLEAHLSGQRADNYDTRCLQCHTVGFNSQKTTNNGGFDDAAKEYKFDLNLLPPQVKEAFRLRHDNNPANDVDYYTSLPPALKAKAGVQCENCHGAGNRHWALAENIAKPWDARVCAQCHDALGFDGKPYAYDSSAHPTLPLLFQTLPVLLKSDCGKCHSAEGFVRQIVEKSAKPPASNIEPHGVSCAACHDPHGSDNPHQLRTVGDKVVENDETHWVVKLDNGKEYRDGGLGNLCVNCHQARVGADLQTVINYDPRLSPHFGPQADVMLGINAWNFGAPFKNGESVHKLVVQDTCVACHMAKVPDGGWSADKGILVGGHSFKIVNSNPLSSGGKIVNFQNTCASCHLTLKTIDRPIPVGRDYDGNGKREGIQTEIKGLMAQIAQALQKRYPKIQVDNQGELDIPSAVFTQMSFNEKAAVYNYNLFLRDGSYGIHNAALTVEALQRTRQVLEEPKSVTGSASSRIGMR